MSKYPKPWQIIQVDPMGNYVVLDANERKLFYISEDDNPDGNGIPGDKDGPTILGYGEEDDDLLNQISEAFDE